MLLTRVIPCLDVADGRVVKGTRFLDLRDSGDPAELAARYAAAGADEIVYLDIAAAPAGRATLLDVVARTCRDVFVPLTVGGGVRSAAEMKAVLRAGADRVAVNTTAVRDPALVRRCARVFGRQCVVVSIDARAWPGQRDRWEVLVRGGRETTGLDAVVWARRAAELGAGEILLTSIDRDGTRDGFELELTRLVTAAVGVPVIASGGAGTAAHFTALFTGTGADAGLAASIFHEGEIAIVDLKAELGGLGIAVRPSAEALS